MILMLRSMISIGISTRSWKFSIEKGPGAQSSNMEMHALFPVAVGVHREKPDGSQRWHVEENVRKSCGCPFQAEVMEGLLFTK